MVWANESERQEINKLLIKLGEIPPEGGDPNPFRVIDASRSPQTYEYLKKLRERWEQMSPNELILPPAEAFEAPSKAEENKPEPKTNDAPKEPAPVKPRTDITLDHGDRELQNSNEHYSLDRSRVILAGQFASLEDPPVQVGDDSASAQDSKSPSTDARVPGTSGQSAKKAPSIRITVDHRGNLVLHSDDPRALDQLETLMREMAPPKPSYDVFRSQACASHIGSSSI